MKRFNRVLAMTFAVAGLVGGASSAWAAGKVECSITKEGKATIQMVESHSACTKLGGTVAMKPKASTAPAPAAVHKEK